MEAAAQTNLKRVTLELGGKSPNIVFKDADCKYFCNDLIFDAYIEYLTTTTLKILNLNLKWKLPFSGRCNP